MEKRNKIFKTFVLKILSKPDWGRVLIFVYAWETGDRGDIAIITTLLRFLVPSCKLKGPIIDSLLSFRPCIRHRLSWERFDEIFENLVCSCFPTKENSTQSPIFEFGIYWPCRKKSAQIYKKQRQSNIKNNMILP